jgi:hypothetical protein
MDWFWVNHNDRTMLNWAFCLSWGFLRGAQSAIPAAEKGARIRVRSKVLFSSIFKVGTDPELDPDWGYDAKCQIFRMVDDDRQLSGVSWPVAGGWCPMDAHGVEGMTDGRRSSRMIPPGTAVRGAHACHEFIVPINGPRLTSYCWFLPLLPSSTIWMSSSALALERLAPALLSHLADALLLAHSTQAAFADLGMIRRRSGTGT